MTIDEFQAEFRCSNCGADPVYVYRHVIREITVPQSIVLQHNGNVDYYPIHSGTQESQELAFYFKCSKCNREWAFVKLDQPTD